MHYNRKLLAAVEVILSRKLHNPGLLLRRQALHHACKHSIPARCGALIGLDLGICQELIAVVKLSNGALIHDEYFVGVCDGSLQPVSDH